MITVTVSYLGFLNTLLLRYGAFLLPLFPTRVSLLGRWLSPPSSKPTRPNPIHLFQEGFPENCSSPDAVGSGRWVTCEKLRWSCALGVPRPWNLKSRFGGPGQHRVPSPALGPANPTPPGSHGRMVSPVFLPSPTAQPGGNHERWALATFNSGAPLYLCCAKNINHSCRPADCRTGDYGQARKRTHRGRE